MLKGCKENLRKSLWEQISTSLHLTRLSPVTFVTTYRENRAVGCPWKQHSRSSSSQTPGQGRLPHPGLTQDPPQLLPAPWDKGHTAAKESADVISLLEVLKNLQTLSPGLKPRACLLILTVFLLFPCTEMILYQKTIVQCTQNTAIHRLHFVRGKKNITFTL